MYYKLALLDAGSTLGDFIGLTTDALTALSPLPHSVVKEEARRFLHCASAPTREVLENFCEAVHIDFARLPQDWTSGFRAYPYAADAVAELCELTGGSAVVLSNIPCTTGPSRMAALKKQLPMIREIYTSYSMGLRKPDRRLWLRIAGEHGVSPDQVLHIGDQWTNDVRGALRAGCRAGFVHGTRPGNVLPPRSEWPEGSEGRVWIGQTLADVVEAVKHAHTG